MGVEIERKFLVKKDKWVNVKPDNGKRIVQGYLYKSPGKTIRVRIKEDQGFITVKGKTEGISRKEYEYEIPASEAQEMIDAFCEKFIEKTRFLLKYEGFLWEVDEFKSPREGLILAEIELSDENQEFSVPEWIEKEVSDDPQYFNANMI